MTLKLDYKIKCLFDNKKYHLTLLVPTIYMNFHYLVCDLRLSMYFVCLQVKHDEIQSKEVGMKMVPEVFLPRLLATKVRWRNKLKSRKCLKEIR